MIRQMRPEDIGDAMRLKQAAGWNQTEQDWVNVMALEPEGCWVWEQDRSGDRDWSGTRFIGSTPCGAAECQLVGAVK